jgi:hypothetical protein
LLLLRLLLFLKFVGVDSVAVVAAAAAVVVGV